MKTRNWYNIIQCLFFLGGMAFLLGCPSTTATQANNGAMAKEDSINPIAKYQSPAIPPIDAAVPSNFETASFGLG